MTREEANEILIEKVKPCVQSTEWGEAVGIAIKALEQEQKLLQALEQEKGAYNALVKNIQCSDCISRQAVLDKAVYTETENGWCSMTVDVKDIESLPSVTPKSKMGHWEWVQYDGNPNIGNWHCSECGSIVIECVSKEKKGGIPLYKYCPQCGARIKEGD